MEFVKLGPKIPPQFLLRAFTSPVPITRLYYCNKPSKSISSLSATPRPKIDPDKWLYKKMFSEIQKIALRNSWIQNKVCKTNNASSGGNNSKFSLIEIQQSDFMVKCINFGNQIVKESPENFNSLGKKSNFVWFFLQRNAINYGKPLLHQLHTILLIVQSAINRMVQSTEFQDFMTNMKVNEKRALEYMKAKLKQRIDKLS